MQPIKKCEKRPPVKYDLHPQFGTVFAPHVLRMDFTLDLKTNQLSEFAPAIIPYEAELFSPGTAVLHYGQTIFEGMKVFRQKGGGVACFRADLHARRFMKSAARLAMPAIGEDVFLKCLREYMDFEQASVPPEPDHALYIRPLLIARDEIIKIGRSKSYTFYIMSAIAGSYFKGGAATAASVLVNREYVRAFPGGLGEVKTAGNYAASLMAQTHAETLKCDQVLYLDAVRHEFVDELGGMNFFMVKGKELFTPPLGGTILAGVTRQSIIELAPTLGLTAKEAPLSFTEMIKDIQAGKVTETFACGTAAVIHSIGQLVVQDKATSPVTTVKLPAQFPVATLLRDTLQKVQRGALEAPGDWLFKA